MLTTSEYHYGCIYKITNLVNGKSYIGQTKRKPELRWKQHKNIKDNFNNSLIKTAIAKYGEDAFSFEVICYANSQVNLNKLEDDLIIKFDSLAPNGYTCLGSQDRSGIISNITIKKMSNARLGKIPWNKGRTYKLSEDSKKNYKNSNKNKCLGRTVSAESKQKMSLAKQGKALSMEHKRKIGLSSATRHHSVESRIKMSLLARGRLHSDITKIKISTSKLKYNIKSINIITNEEKLYNSPLELIKDGFNYGSVYKAATGRDGRKQHKGFKWVLIPIEVI
jgi:group I intron endonuclease